MNSRKPQQGQSNVIKYCSDRCRHRKPGPLDRKIENKIVALLNAEPDSGIDQTAAKSKVTKGDRRILVACDEIEEVVFGSRHDPTKTFGRKKNRATRALGGGSDEEWKSVDMMESEDTASDHAEEIPPPPSQPEAATHVRPPQTESDVNFSVGGERGWAERKQETPEELQKRIEGQKRAEEREMVRRAARRLIVFGHEVEGNVQHAEKSQPKTKGRSKKQDPGNAATTTTTNRRLAEAVMNGSVVEPSFAKGNWAIRWREQT
ncbi:hypothetical protein ABEF95_003229 [Exophiala dermatitidis]